VKKGKVKHRTALTEKLENRAGAGKGYRRKKKKGKSEEKLRMAKKPKLRLEKKIRHKGAMIKA